MRTKPKAEPITCRACGLQVLGRGGDLEGWKAVQMDPTKAELAWYCMKAVCQHAYSASFGEAQMIWASRLPQPPQETPEELPPPPGPPEPEETQEAAESPGELDQSEHDQSSDQAPSDQAPPELLAFETTDPEEAGFKDEPFPYSRFALSDADEALTEEPVAPPPPKPQSERYVPKPSAQSKARFIRREGTGEPDE